MGAVNSAIRPYPADGPRSRSIRSLGRFQPFLHGCHLSLNAPTGGFSLIKLYVHGDPVTVFSEILKYQKIEIGGKIMKQNFIVMKRLKRLKKSEQLKYLYCLLIHYTLGLNMLSILKIVYLYIQKFLL